MKAKNCKKISKEKIINSFKIIFGSFGDLNLEIFIMTKFEDKNDHIVKNNTRRRIFAISVRIFHLHLSLKSFVSLSLHLITQKKISTHFQSSARLNLIQVEVNFFGNTKKASIIKLFIYNEKNV